MKIPSLQDQLNILFNRYGDGPISLIFNKGKAQDFITNLINVGIEADEENEANACKREYIKLWNNKDRTIAEEQFSWFWLNY